MTQPLAVPLGTAKPVQPANSGRSRLEDDVVMSDDEEFKEATDVSMTTEPRPLTVPPSQQLASSMGVSTHRMQVMKASFFGSDSNNTSLERQPPPRALTHPSIFQTTPSPSSLLLKCSPLVHSGDRRVPPQHLPSWLQRSGGRGAQSPMLSSQPERYPHPASPMPSGQPERYPHPAITSLQAQASIIMAKHNLFQLVPREKSLSNDETNNIADAALMLGRSFRVGWGANWTLAHSGKQISHSTDSKPIGLFSSVPDSSGLVSSSEGLPLRVLVEQVLVGTSEGAASTPPKPVSVHLALPVVDVVDVCSLATLVLLLHV